MAEQLTKPGVKKTVRLDRNEIYVTCERTVPGRHPTIWAAVDMNLHDTYACTGGTLLSKPNITMWPTRYGR